MESVQKIRLFLDKRPKGVLRFDGSFALKNTKDYFATVILLRDAKLVDDYIDISLDSTRETLGRQEVNPYFIELGFFESITVIGEETDSPNDDESIKGKSKKFDITINS